MIIQVYDKCMEGDDKIGETNIKAASLCTGTGIDEWYPIHYKGNEVGRLHLKSTWDPNGDANDEIETAKGDAAIPIVVMQQHPGMLPPIMA